MNRKINAKEYLRDFRLKNIYLEQLRMEIERLNTDICGGAINYGDRVQSSNSNYENQLARLVDLKNTLEEQKLKYLDRYEFVNSVLTNIGAVELECILRYRYVEGMRWEDIATKLNYSRSWLLQNKHPKALRAFEKSFEEIERTNKKIL